MTMVEVQGLFLRSSCSLDYAVFEWNGDMERMIWVLIARRVCCTSAAFARRSTSSTINNRRKTENGERIGDHYIYFLCHGSRRSTVDGRFFLPVLDGALDVRIAEWMTDDKTTSREGLLSLAWVTVELDSGDYP
jgi:hypothetical protein